VIERDSFGRAQQAGPAEQAPSASLSHQQEPMSLAVLRSRALAGMLAPAVNVEVHLANGLPGLTIAGLKTPITAYWGHYGLS
jgi:magnesium chelatase family protein